MCAGPARSFAALARDGAAALAAAGLAQAFHDAELLLRYALGVDLEAWLTRARDPAPDGIIRTFRTLIERRARREPIAYITGVREFYGRPFRVTPAVLIPRPETEMVVDEARRAIAHRRSQAGRPLRLADVGTGSGCLAVTLALEEPGLEILATDVSADALDVARSNATALGARDIRFRETSLLDGEPAPFDVIVSNPPYVRAGAGPTLMRDVREYEPAIALFGGDDGLCVIRALLETAGHRLAPGGRLVMEIGSDQADEVSALVRDSGVSVEAIVPDLAGHPRVVVAHRTADTPASV